MRKIILFLLIGAFLAACGKDASVTTLADPSPDQELASSEAGLSILIEKQTYTESPSAIETKINNDSGQNFGFGEYYHIELKRDGEWYIVTHSDAVFLNNPQLNDFGHVLLGGGEADVTFSIEKLGIVLAPGKYRLVKTFLSQEELFFEVSIAAPFVIE